MSEVLHAWVCGAYVGWFERRFEADPPRFHYTPQATADISLSLPRGTPAPRRAAANFLEAMLPENPAARDSMRALANARSSSSWDLLSVVGGDLPGGIVLHPQRREPAHRVAFLSRAYPDDIADRIRQIRRGGTGFTHAGLIPRFSLAGVQPKFALAKRRQALFWPDESTPSTHILKPETREHAGMELVEAATLELARRAGIRAANARQETYEGETAFAIERFDRRIARDGSATRLHVEDMTQALGTPVSGKYLVHAEDIIALLKRQPNATELVEDFLRQFAFNVIIGNADAHAKNYSLLHTAHGIRISPLYDAIPIGMFPQYDQSLSMPVGWADQPGHVTLRDWNIEAKEAGLDPGWVRGIVDSVARGVAEHLEATLGAVHHARVTQDALARIELNADRQMTH